MFRKQEFGVELETKISDLCVPRDYRVLEVERCWGNRTRVHLIILPLFCEYLLEVSIW